MEFVYHRFSLICHLKENIDELIYEVTIRAKKHKIRNAFSIRNYLNANTDKDKDFIEDRIRYLLENRKLKKTSLKIELTPTLKSTQLILQF